MAYLRATFLLLVAVAINFQESRAILELVQGELPEDVEVHHGKFSDKGKYRLIHPTDGFHSEFTYNGLLLETFHHKLKYTDIYVEEFKDNERLFLEFTGVYKKEDGSKGYSKCNYKLVIEDPGVSSRDYFSMMTNDVILLYVSMNSNAPVHPFIQKSYLSPGADRDDIPILTTDVPARLDPDILKAEGVRFQVSYCFDDVPVNKTVIGRKPTCIIGSSRKIIRNVEGQGYILVVSHKGYELEYLVDPKTGVIALNSNVESDASDFWKPSTWILFQKYNVIVNVAIMLGATENYSPYVLFLANVRKGEWEYSRYEIVPFIPVRQIQVEIFAEKDGRSIYLSPSRHFVTSVSVFLNTGNLEEFVMVEYRCLRNGNKVIATKIFKRGKDARERTIYSELDKALTELYILRLQAIYNLPYPTETSD